MIESIEYVAFRKNDGSIRALARLITNESGLWGEALVNGQWVPDRTVIEVLIDPGYADFIGFAEAKAAAMEWGVTLMATGFERDR